MDYVTKTMSYSTLTAAAGPVLLSVFNIYINMLNI